MKPKSVLLLAASLATLGAFAQDQQAAEMAYMANLTAIDTVATAARDIKAQKVEAPAAATEKKTGQSWWRRIRATGAVSTEFLIPETDKAIREIPYEKHVLNNTYFDLTVTAPYVSIGGRFEWAKWPLPGFEDDFKGWGVPYIWATGSYKWAKLTVGDFYEQFGSGLILRTYQERSLGVDNAIRGGRLKLNPGGGVYFTALAGKQRRYWETNSTLLWGADVEWALNEAFPTKFGRDYGLTLGVSYVGKHEKDEIKKDAFNENRLRFPRNVAAFDGRAKILLKNFNILAEFATKNNDPSADNNFTYRRGYAELLSVTYSQKGFSAFLQAKRSENMNYRSKRSEIGISSYINHMPAFTLTQTYALAAMYPYATQPNGEWAFQGEVRWLAKKGSPLGGKYGTNFRLSASYISSLDKPHVKSEEANFLYGTNGYGSAFWKIGGLNYADLNLEINKKFSRKWQFTLFYLFQKYNQEVVEGHAVDERYPIVTSNIFILEGQWKIAKKVQLRFEAQYLNAKGDKGDWWCGLVELSLAPHWMFTVQEMYNSGNDDTSQRIFFNAMVTFNYRANRFTLGYGRTREGYNCSGGVCRWVPASRGFTLSYNYTF